MEKNKYDLTVIIVSWNVKNYLITCIESIISQFKNISYEIILVDNASSDFAPEVVEDKYKKNNIKIIKNRENVGFAKANQQGLELAMGEAVLFINPDTIILTDNIGELISRLRSEKSIGIIGCGVLNKDLTIQKTCARFMPNLRRKLFDFILMSDYIKTFKGNGQYYKDANYEKKMFVECISGCFILVKKKILERLGSFDEAYFMYAEDIELCYRVRNNGYKILYMPEMKILHYGGMSSAQQSESYFSTIKKYESDYQLFKIINGSKKALILRLIISVGSIIRLFALCFNLFRLKNSKFKSKKIINKHLAILKWAIFFKS
jgi:hypothetical protein